MAPGLQTRKFATLVSDGSTAALDDIHTSYGTTIAGKYTTAAPTFTNGQYGHLRMSADGKLMVDTELTIDGDLVIDNLAKARSSQETAVANDDPVTLITNLNGELVLASYNWTTSKLGTTESNPISTHHIEETLADVTNETNATNYYYFDMDGYKFFSAQIEIGAAADTCTVTIEATCQDDGTAAASCTYQDVSTAWFGAASWTADVWLEKDTPCSAKYIRVKTVTAGGNNDADYAIYHKRGY